MTRLDALVVVALLVYGLIVGCWDGTHRDARIDEAFTRGLQTVCQWRRAAAVHGFRLA